MAKRAPERADAFFKSHDKDNDGKLTLEEYKARPAKKENAQ
jgi:Ca2+-binding EF-hand superfamily protein